MNPFGTGAIESQKDIRTFTYVPSKAPQKGGTKYLPEDSTNQHKVGICTAADITQNASKAFGVRFNMDFQYGEQKRQYDSKYPIGWQEGSSNLVALKVGKNIGFLPESEWTHTTEADRELPYNEYIAKLQAIPDAEWARLETIASQYKLTGYASVPVDVNSIENAINESKSGVISMFYIDKNWWTDVHGNVTWDKSALEPLRAPNTNGITGHSVTLCNFDGGSIRVANEWSAQWADGGTAYFLYSQYQPREVWMPYYPDNTPNHVIQQLQNRVSLLGKLADALQQLLILTKLIKQT